LDAAVGVDLRVRSFLVDGAVVGREQAEATGRWPWMQGMCLVSGSRGSVVWPHDRTQEDSCDLMHRACVRSSVSYAGVSIAGKRNEVKY
jgi:hypothetical protein